MLVIKKVYIKNKKPNKILLEIQYSAEMIILMSQKIYSIFLPRTQTLTINGY